MLAAGDDWGGGTAAERASGSTVEFVSANPTGPLTAASGRHAAYGDALARLLEFAGHEVAREYYFNDAGAQVRKLGASVRARARDEPVPEDGYQGDYVAELAAQIPGAAERDPERPRVAGGALMIERIRATLERYRVDFDVCFLERRCTRRPAPIDRALRAASSGGPRRTSPRARCGCARPTFGDDKDRVLERSTGDADLLRGRRRLPREQARARLRPADQRRSAPTTTATSRA